MNKEQVNFGFRLVNSEDKPNLVKGVFSSVAKKYDLMNDLMSAGIHRIWKNKMIEEIDFANISKPYRIIDVAGGTGDIAFRIIKKARQKNAKCEVEVVDINQSMLDVGKARAIDQNLFSDLKFTCCDGEKLVFADQTFDFFTIAFGIRNFTNLAIALSEAYRVLKPQGKFICLEFHPVNDYFLQKIYDFYSFKVIPKIGEILLRDRDSYCYLVESIRKFPTQIQFQEMIKKAGFQRVRFKNLTSGIASIHIGEKN